MKIIKINSYFNLKSIKIKTFNNDIMKNTKKTKIKIFHN